MVTTALDGASLEPSDIEARRFSLARKGFDMDEVHAFLQVVAERLRRLQGEIDWQHARGDHLERRTAEARDAAYARISRDFAEILRRADEAALRVRAQAEEEARAAINSARQQANRLVASAGEQARKILLSARTEAERMVKEARLQVEQVVRNAALDADQAGGSGSADADRARQIAMASHRSARRHEEAIEPTASENPYGSDRPPEGNGHGTVGRLSVTDPGSSVPDIEEDIEDLDLGLDPSLFDLFDDTE